MATEPTIPVESLLEPLPGDNPSGIDLAYLPEYDELRRARTADEALIQGDWKREVKTADRKLVLTLGCTLLRTKTKDLQIAAWVAEALIHLHGFAGLRDGFRLMHGIQTRFWDTYHPQVEDGDLDSRSAPFKFLNAPAKGLSVLIRGVPMTDSDGERPFSLADYDRSRDIDNQIRKTPDKERAILSEAPFTSKMVNEAIRDTPKASYASLAEDIRECVAAFDEFEADTDRRFGSGGPSLLNVRGALQAYQHRVDIILAEKRQADPDPQPAPPVPDRVPPATTDGPPEILARPEPAREAPAPSASAPAIDLGGLLIEFRETAQSLAEAGKQLAENRARRAELAEEMAALDAEYDQVARSLLRERKHQALLTRLLGATGRDGAAEARGRDRPADPDPD